MKPLGEILSGLAARDRVPGVTIAGLCLDSRRIAPGDAFVALAGGRAHGLEFAEQALAAGASVVLHDADAEPPAAIASRCVAVPGLADRLPELARRYWDDPGAGLELVAVTGTNGKSSVAWLLAQALDGSMIGTLGIGRTGPGDEARLDQASHTTPDLPSVYCALARLRDEGEKRVILEASSHALDQKRLAGLEFTTVVLTNLGRDHLDYHGSIEAYGKAKARLFHDYPSRRKLINADDAFGRALAAGLGEAAGVVRYGLEPANQPEVLGRMLQADLEGLWLEITTPRGRVRCRSRLLGRVNASNLLIVAAELDAREWPAERIRATVRALTPVPGRMNRIDGPAGQRVVIDYAHTPDALERALAGLRELTQGRVVCVFGCGGERDRGKRPIMGRVAESLADEVVITDDNPRSEDHLRILREIQSGMARPDRARVIPDRARAIARAIAGTGPADCVLVAGKGHERYQDLGDRVIEFSDRDAVRQALTEAA